MKTCAMLALLTPALFLALSAQEAAPDADPTVPAHAVLALEAQGNGVQIYTCTAQASSYSWVLTAPEASLIDPTGDEIGRHSAGPTWTFNDGSSVTGKVLQKKASDEDGSIPWLLLAATVPPGHPGQADKMAFVRRYNTHGGVAPASGCDADHAGKTARVPYTATYAFYTAEAKSLPAEAVLSGAASPQRRYADGAVSHYLMTGNNDGWQYTIRATDTVKRDVAGRYYEEIGWSDLTSNAQQTLAPASLALRQTVSLDDPASYLRIPNLAKVQPLLIGPITDTLTFYSDLLLANKANLMLPGQTAYVSRITPNSWADGQRVLLGQDVVDFSISVESVNSATNTETLQIQHVAPPALHVEQPAKWMQKLASAKPNNFVQISREGDGFIAETGEETFDVKLVLDTRDGSILSAAMHNPVVLTVRTCTDRELTHCGSEVPKTILREVTLQRVQ